MTACMPCWCHEDSNGTACVKNFSATYIKDRHLPGNPHWNTYNSQLLEVGQTFSNRRIVKYVLHMSSRT